MRIFLINQLILCKMLAEYFLMIIHHFLQISGSSNVSNSSFIEFTDCFQLTVFNMMPCYFIWLFFGFYLLVTFSHKPGPYSQRFTRLYTFKLVSQYVWYIFIKNFHKSFTRISVWLIFLLLLVYESKLICSTTSNDCRSGIVLM